MKVLITGGRDYADAAMFYARLSEIQPDEIAHGNASGADHLATRWAHAKNVPVTIYPADWGLYGRAAGPLRNEQMLSDFHPDLVLAFPGGKGTADMVRRARVANVPVIEVGARDADLFDVVPLFEVGA